MARTNLLHFTENLPLFFNETTKQIISLRAFFMPAQVKQDLLLRQECIALLMDSA